MRTILFKLGTFIDCARATPPSLWWAGLCAAWKIDPPKEAL